jgi:polynucleotide 5'-hydroxyl-kinase GRC3/NOL9
MAEVSPPQFCALVQEMSASGGVCFVLGRTDVGKSTIVQNLMRLITARGQAVAILDADLGQSTYGLPTTLNLVRFEPGGESPAPELLASVFVGATSPVGYLLQTAVGCRRLLDCARSANVRTVLIDTTGLVEGELAVEFKLQKIELLQPTHLLALARHAELDPILQTCSRRTALRICRLPISPATRVRSAEERRANRQEKYRRYFTALNSHRFALGTVAVWGRAPRRPSPDTSGLLIGLIDGQGFCLGVGLLREQTLRAVEVLAPLSTVAQVRLLRFGSVAIDPQGNERIFSPRAW